MTTLRVSAFSRQSAFVVAQERGFFDDAGIEVAVEAARGSRQQLTELLAERLDIVHTNPDNVMRFRAQGHEELFCFLVVDLGLGQTLIVQPEITSWEGLRGGRVGGDATDSGYALLLYEMMARNGVERGSYETVGLGSTALRLDGLRRKEISGCLLNHDQGETATREGFRALAAAKDYFPLHPGAVASTSRPRAAALGGALQGYVDALLAAARWAHDPANEAGVIEAMAAQLGISEERAGALLEREKAARTGTAPTPAEAAQSLQVVARVRHASTGVEPSGYFDDRYMRAAAGAGS